MHSWANVANIIKTKNLHGGLVAKSTQDLLLILVPGTLVWFVPPQKDCPRKALIEDIKPLSGDCFYLAFDVISSVEIAGALVGCSLLVETDDVVSDRIILDSEERAEPLKCAYSGFSVRDSTFGNLGSVVSIIDNPLQSVLVVRGSFGEILIPLVEEFVRLIDAENHFIKTAIPEGLLDL
jgi:16S rRNA processing protein RimM